MIAPEEARMGRKATLFDSEGGGTCDPAHALVEMSVDEREMCSKMEVGRAGATFTVIMPLSLPLI